MRDVIINTHNTSCTIFVTRDKNDNFAFQFGVRKNIARKGRLLSNLIFIYTLSQNALATDVSFSTVVGKSSRVFL